MEEQADKPTPENTENKKGMKTWLKSLGLAGFLFFFIKGLVWLAIFFGLVKACN